MQVIAVPVKALPLSKSRLAPLISPAERAALTLAMLEDVLASCLEQPGWEVWVVSRADQALDLATRRGARPVPERGSTLLTAVRQAEAAALGRDPGTALAVVLADLPLLSAESLATALAIPGPVVAAPAESDGGTNLLVRRPSSVIPARFGRSSFERHRAEAYRAGLTFQEAGIPELAFDLDRPEDLAALLTAGVPCRTLTACVEMELADRLRVRS